MRWRVETYSGMKAETLTAKGYPGIFLALALGVSGLPDVDWPPGREVRKRA